MKGLEFSRQFLRAASAPFFSHRVDTRIATLGKRVEDALALAFDVAVLQLDELKISLPLEALGKVVAERGQRAVLHFANGYDGVAEHL